MKVVKTVMTIGDLKKALSKFPDNNECLITIESNYIAFIERIILIKGKDIVNPNEKDFVQIDIRSTNTTTFEGEVIG